MVKARRAKAHSFRAFHICGNDIEAAAQLAKIIGATKHVERALQIVVQSLVIKQPRRGRVGENGHRLQETLVVRVADETAKRRGQQAGYCQQSPAKFTERGPVENFGMEGVHFCFVAHKDPAKLGRCHLIGKVRRDKRAGIDTNIDIDVVKIQAIQRLIQRSQSPDFIYTTQRATATKGETDSGAGLYCRRRCCHSLSPCGFD